MLDNTFYIKTDNSSYLSHLLQELSHTVATNETPPQDIFIRKRDNAGSLPDLLYGYKNIGGWYGVDHNASEPLYEWGAVLSAKLNTQFIQIRTIHEIKPSFLSTEDIECNYFLYYDQGVKQREIKVRSDQSGPLLDEGKKFDFEAPFIHAPGGLIEEDEMDDIYNLNIYEFFSDDSVIEYCLEFGIDPEYADDKEYFVLRKSTDFD
jgi:hypothetical protein